MRNREVERQLQSCSQELEGIKQFLTGMGDAATPTPYMKRYAVIRASGTIEVGFKQIIADKVDADCAIQVKNFVRKKIRENSVNPRLGQIQAILQDFDNRWGKKFEELVGLGDKPRYSGALSKLVNARNEFAHGGTPNIDIASTIEYFNSGVEVLRILDQVVHHEFEEGEDEPVIEIQD
ncbi:hypothetical protein SAMN05216178_2620 [Pseudomonas saponiphila]|uniref:RiboL-PSP-HEPN domain-containing protein n=1 Tax=Pseudomonas saponiphila TaxID=556534 RepID=A0A1H4N023_9PSED|nr:HEPN domain-containing protein [Pseudomonas saponiphila]SEB88374.1 hypothetical protein SAMN05216178_2620 [Pseudomonas saponiphila]